MNYIIKILPEEKATKAFYHQVRDTGKGTLNGIGFTFNLQDGVFSSLVTPTQAETFRRLTGFLICDNKGEMIDRGETREAIVAVPKVRSEEFVQQPQLDADEIYINEIKEKLQNNDYLFRDEMVRVLDYLKIPYPAASSSSDSELEELRQLLKDNVLPEEGNKIEELTQRFLGETEEEQSKYLKTDLQEALEYLGIGYRSQFTKVELRAELKKGLEAIKNKEAQSEWSDTVF